MLRVRARGRQRGEIVSRVLLVLVLLLAPLLASAQPASSQECATPTAMTDGWQIAAPDAVGLNANALCQIGVRLTAWTAADVHAVLVIRHSKLVYERYFTGTDTPLSKPPRTVTFDAGGAVAIRVLGRRE